MESFIPEPEVLQQVATYFASWLADNIFALDPHGHTEEKDRLYTLSLGKSSPNNVPNGEVDQESYLHHVALVPYVDVLVPDEDYDCQEEEEDADGEGDRVEAGKEVFVVLAFWWF